MEVEVIVTGTEETLDRLNRASDGLNNLTRPMGKIGNYLTSFFSGQVFASRGGVIGKPWAPLNARYAVQKARTWPGRPPLVQTGAMMRSFESSAAPRQVRIYNTDEKFDWHQGGTTHMPARTMMHVDETRARSVAEIISDHIDEVLAR